MLLPVAQATDIEPGTLTRIEVDGEAICLARADTGDFFAVTDTCSHEEYSLSEGDLWGTELECPMHGSRFNLVTGEPDQLPAVRPIRTFRVVVEGGEVFIDTSND